MIALSAISRYLRNYAPTASTSSLRQRQWALERLHLAAAVQQATGFSSPSAEQVRDLTASALSDRLERMTLAELLDPATAEPLVDLAGRRDVVALRWAPRSPDDSSSARRARVAALRSLAAWAGLPLPLDSVPPQDLREPAVTSDSYLALEAVLRSPAASAAEARFRALALASAASGMGPAALCAMDLAALGALPATLPSRLVGLGQAAVAQWAAVRLAAISGLEGSTRAAWISLAPNHRPGPTRLPPGVPLRPRGLERSWQAQARRANAELAGSPGFPLPSSLTLWARAFRT